MKRRSYGDYRKFIEILRFRQPDVAKLINEILNGKKSVPIFHFISKKGFENLCELHSTMLDYFVPNNIKFCIATNQVLFLESENLLQIIKLQGKTCLLLWINL